VRQRPLSRSPLAGISTLCPRCGELATWYSLEDRVLGVCPNHGIVDSFPVRRRPRMS